MLHELPFRTIGDVARYGLELHVYCSGCYAKRRLDVDRTDLKGRCFAKARFRCGRCGTVGVPKVQPGELLKVGGPVILAFLWCPRCIWEIDQVRSTSRHGQGRTSGTDVQAVDVRLTGIFTAPSRIEP
jgi:hypothetical protein